MILSTLTDDELRQEIRIKSYPKWWTLCLLRLLGLPTLDASFLRPDSSKAETSEKIHSFSSLIKKTNLLLRSDGGIERKNYTRGGKTYEYTQALSVAMRFFEQERAVIVMEPTNRLSNKLSVNAMIDEMMGWSAETLSCGFDTSDLQRDLVTPEYSWTGSWHDEQSGLPAKPRKESGGAVTTISMIDRINQRLESIADLYELGKAPRGVELARTMLLETGNTCLFDTKRKIPSWQEVRQVIEDAALVASALDASFRPLTLSYARLSDGRGIYWDVVFGKHKWNIGFRPGLSRPV